MQTRVVMQGDIILLYEAHQGRWIFAAGPSFPSIPADGFPMPHEGAVFFRTDLGSSYVWGEVGQVWSILGGGAPGSLTVREIDGTPIVSDVTTLQFDQAVGIVVTEEAPGVARATLAAVPQSAISGLVADLAAKEATGVAASLVAAHEAAADPHVVYQRESEKDAASGYAGLSAGTKLAGAQQTYGTAVNTACEGNDARLSDARTPTAHAANHLEGSTDPIRPTFLKFGGTTSSFPGLLRSGAALLCQLADDSSLAEFAANNIIVISNFSLFASGGSPSTGALRISHGASGAAIVTCRNVADSADLTLLARDGSDNPTTNGQIIETRNNKAAASGYASLDGTTKVPTAELATGTPDGTKFLRDDRVWAAPTAAAADPVYSPGSFTVATETSRTSSRRLKFTGAQRAAIQGTGCLRIT